MFAIRQQLPCVQNDIHQCGIADTDTQRSHVYFCVRDIVCLARARVCECESVLWPSIKSVGIEKVFRSSLHACLRTTARCGNKNDYVFEFVWKFTCGISLNLIEITDQYFIFLFLRPALVAHIITFVSDSDFEMYILWNEWKGWKRKKGKRIHSKWIKFGRRRSRWPAHTKRYMSS